MSDLLISQGVPEHYCHLVRLGARLQTQVLIEEKLVVSSSGEVICYNELVDHVFMYGRIQSLSVVPCAGHITLASHAGVSVLVGNIHVWNSRALYIVDELRDVLQIASNRFIKNHPSASSTMACQLTPILHRP